MNRRLATPRRPVALGAVLLLGPVAGSSAPVRNVATSQAFAIRIVVPGQARRHRAATSRRRTTQSRPTGGFSYPADGVRAHERRDHVSASANAAGTTATAAASAEVTGISLFGGEVTVQRRRREADATAGAGDGIGDFTGHGGQRHRRLCRRPGASSATGARSPSAPGSATEHGRRTAGTAGTEASARSTSS